MPTSRVPYPTRIGLHLNTNSRGDLAVRYARAVQPSAMKLLEVDGELVRQIREVSPQTTIIYRPYWSDQKLDRHRDFRNFALDKVRGFGPWKPDYVEGYNEWGGHGTSDRDWDRFAQEEVSFARLMNENGYGAAIGGFSTGFLDEGKRITAFREAFQYMQRVGPSACVYHGHEYSGPYMGYMCETPGGRDQWRNGWTGYSDEAAYWDPAMEGWLTLRYRKLRALLLREGFSRVRMLVTESGVDDVNPRPGAANAKGWRDYHGTSWSSGPLGDFADQMAWYAWQLSQDPFVIGAVDFGFATHDPAWDSFDLAQTPRMFERMISKQAELVLTEGGPTPEPVPPPAPAPEPDGDRIFAGIEVRRGEGLYSVARAAGFHNVHEGARALAEANGLPWPPTLEVGQVLRVPRAVIVFDPRDPANAPQNNPAPEPDPEPLSARDILTHLRVVVDPAELTAHRHQISRVKTPLFGIVAHDPAGNRKNPPTPLQVRRYLQSNSALVSSHFTLEPGEPGERCAAVMLADPRTHTVYHAGPSSRRYHGAMPRGRVTHSTIGVEAFRRADAPSDEPWPNSMLRAYAELCAYLTYVYQLAPPEVGLVGHGEIQSNRTDPRALNMDALRRETSIVYQALLASGLSRTQVVEDMVD